jgi:hypothetical protein
LAAIWQVMALDKTARRRDVGTGPPHVENDKSGGQFQGKRHRADLADAFDVAQDTHRLLFGV